MVKAKRRLVPQFLYGGAEKADRADLRKNQRGEIFGQGREETENY